MRQFEKDNPLTDLLIISLNSEPVFLTCNNATKKVTIVKLNDHRHSLIKTSVTLIIPIFAHNMQFQLKNT